MLSNEYVAGFFDGEGCVSINTTGRCTISITQKNPEVLYLIQKQYGGNVHCKWKKHFECSHWLTNGKQDVIRFLNLIKPYVVVKKKEIDLGLQAAALVRDGNIGCNPLSIEERETRMLIRQQMQELRPKKTFQNLSSQEYLYRENIKKLSDFKCNACGKDLKDTRIRDQIVSQDKLWCRGCAASRTNKKPLKPISKDRIEEVLSICNSLDEACKILDIGRSALFKKRKEYGLPPRIMMRGKRHGTYR